MAFVYSPALSPFVAHSSFPLFPRRRTPSPVRPRSWLSLSLSTPDWKDSSSSPESTSKWIATPPSPPSSPPEHNDYNGWSSDFLQLCNAQLSLLMSTIPNLRQVILFFRHEAPRGALEFVPLIVRSADTADHPRVWINSGAAGQTELEDAHYSRALPGGIPAQWLLPDYPFTAPGQSGILMSDGGLCVPVEYNHVLAGSIVLVPQTLTPISSDKLWPSEDVQRADMVAKSIALAAGMEGKWHASQNMLGTSRSLLSSVRTLLRTTLHQIRSPISALVTFGHLLLRKLPPGDSNRGLAKNIILESLRVDELLEPLDGVGEMFVLQEAGEDHPWFEKNITVHNPLQPADKEYFPVEYSLEKAVPQNVRDDSLSTPSVTSNMEERQLIWLQDVLHPQAKIYSTLASEKGIEFTSDIDNDAPPVLVVEKYVREAISNLIDNSFKYSPLNSQVGIICSMKKEPLSSEARNSHIEIVVWDTGYGFSSDEVDNVWNYGFRGSAAEKSNCQGSGIGLPIVRELLNACKADVKILSPLPESLDPRTGIEEGQSDAPGSAFVMQFMRPSL